MLPGSLWRASRGKWGSISLFRNEVPKFLRKGFIANQRFRAKGGVIFFQITWELDFQKSVYDKTTQRSFGLDSGLRTVKAVFFYLFFFFLFFLLVKALHTPKLVKHVGNYSSCGNVPLIAGQQALFDKPTKYKLHLLSLGHAKTCHKSPKCLLRGKVTSQRNHWSRLFNFSISGIGKDLTVHVRTQNLNKVSKEIGWLLGMHFPVFAAKNKLDNILWGPS